MMLLEQEHRTPATAQASTSDPNYRSSLINRQTLPRPAPQQQLQQQYNKRNSQRFATIGASSKSSGEGDGEYQGEPHDYFVLDKEYMNMQEHQLAMQLQQQQYMNASIN